MKADHRVVASFVDPPCSLPFSNPVMLVGLDIDQMMLEVPS